MWDRRQGSTLLWLPVLLALPLLVGCVSLRKTTGQDVALITEGSENKAPQPKGTGPLWPLLPGTRWQMLTYRDAKNSVGSEIRVMGDIRVEDGRTGILVHSFRNGKLYRVEIYQKDATGNLLMIGLGESEKKLLLFTPAIPVVKSPVREGETLSWNGTARIEHKDYGANALHRISGVEGVKTLFDTIQAYRMDGIISLYNGTQRIDYPVVTWFVPGKGPAQRRLVDQGKLTMEVITRFPSN